MKQTKINLTFNIVIDSKIARRSGNSKVYFRIKEGRVKRDIYTKVSWPQQYFDKSHQQLMPRFDSDPDVSPYNLRLNEFKAVAHRLLLSGFVKQAQVSIDDLVKEFANVGRSDDFFLFMEGNANDLYNTDVIVYNTWCRHKSSLTILKEYWKKKILPVNQIDLEFIERFDAWARKTKKKSHNTVCGYHKDLKKYLTIAARKCLIESNPYREFKFAYVDGDRQALTKEDVQKLYFKLQNNEFVRNEPEICRRFLFSCVTGLRISDTAQVTRNMISDNVLNFIPHKGRQKGKHLKIPLPKVALELINGREGLLFAPFSDPYVNETLKFIAARADIEKRLTYHCARDTFGTLFIEMGGDIKSLCQLMGHHSTKTTEIYIKMSDKRKQTLMNNFDTLF